MPRCPVPRKVRNWMQRPKQDKVALQVDFVKGFGSVFRDKLLEEVKTHCPLIYPHAASCYRHPNLLAGSGYNLLSSRGVQQGDAFALAFHLLVLRLQQLSLELNLWYLDDGILCGRACDINKALTLIRKHYADIEKCKLIGPGADSDLCPEFSDIPKIPLSERSIFLGVRVGSAAFVEKAMVDVTTKLRNMLAKVGALSSSVAKFLILRACFGACRVNHLLRSLDYLPGKHLAANSTELFQQALADTLGLHP